MTEYELVSLYEEGSALLGSHIDTYLTILFAVVVAAYLTASKLTNTMVCVAIGLFTEATFLVSFAVYRTSRDLVNLASEIRAVGQESGSSLSFHALSYEPILVMASVPWMMMGLVAVTYGAVIYFFFHVRRNAQQNAEPAGV